MMINTVEALQGLYVALGGELSNVANITTIPEMLTAISSVAAAAASELPVVTASDNGKVLGVVNGAWNKMDAPSDSLVLKMAWAGNDMLYGADSVSNNLTQKDVCDLVKSKRVVIIYAGQGVDGTHAFMPTWGDGTDLSNVESLTFTAIRRKTSSTVYASFSMSASSTTKLSAGVGPVTSKEISDPTAEG